MERFIKPLVSSLTFAIGVAFALIDFYPFVVLSPVAMYVLFHISVFVIVLHQLMMRQNSRRQVVGKGLLAVIFWQVPSLVALVVSLNYSLPMILSGENFNMSLPVLILIIVIDVFYVALSWRLCCWIKNPQNEELGMWGSTR